MDSPPLTKRAGSATTGCDDIGMKNDGPGSSRFLQGWGNNSESERWVTSSVVGAAAGVDPQNQMPKCSRRHASLTPFSCSLQLG